MKALILNKKVIDIKDKEFPVSSDCKWVDCDDEKVKIGWNYDGSKFTDIHVETTVTDEELASLARSDRNLLLDQSDWTQMPDSPLTDEVKTSWATYRTALRDLPAHENWPSLEDADWPSAPS